MKNKISFAIIFYLGILCFCSSFTEYKSLALGLKGKECVEKGTNLPNQFFYRSSQHFFGTSGQGFEPIKARIFSGNKSGITKYPFYNKKTYTVKPAHGFLSTCLFLVFNNLRI